MGISATTRTISALVGIVLLSAGGACHAAAPPLPKTPQTISIIDVGGVLALTQAAIENYRKVHPELVAKFNFTKAPGPELPGKLKAQQDAGRVDIDLVLSGIDGISDGIEQNLYIRVLPDYAEKFPDIEANYLPGALKMHRLAEGYAVDVVYTPAGPLLEYAPERVKDAPGTTDELLAWCKTHPNRFFYARPANSGPGRALLLGLPYLLGDSDPRDPIHGWDKTWAYLKELNTCIDYYPSGTAVTMKEFGEGSRDVIAATAGWEINPRVLGVVPKSAAIRQLSGPKGSIWVADAQFMAIPKGISQDKLAVVLDLMAFMLQPAQQAMTYDNGYFYPGPAVKNVPLALAPQESQDAIREFGRLEYDRMIADNPIEVPIFGGVLVAAHRKWDEEIGSKSK